MSDLHVAAARLPYEDRVRRIDTNQIRGWLQAGWRDLLAAPAVSLSYGFVFAAVGLALTLGLWRTSYSYMLAPLAAGFMLVGPVLTTGFHVISRDLEKGRRPTYASAWSAVQANAGPLSYAALAFMLLFLAWLRISQLLFALTFPAGTQLDPQNLLSTTFLTAGGLTFLILFLGFGLAVAALALAAGAFALPMLIDRSVGAGEAMATSFTAVVMNLRPMAVWAMVLVGLVAAGMAVFFVGLIVTLPIAGHAAWHAYRATIRA